MKTTYLILLLCCCCVLLLGGGGAAFAYWYFYHYLKEAPAPQPSIPPPIPTITPPPPTPSITPPTPGPKPSTGGPPPPIGNNNLTDVEYTSGTFMQLASIIDDPQAVEDMNGIRWYDHTPPLVRYDMVRDAGKIVAIVVTDDHPGTLRWLPELVRRILDASVFLYRNLKHEEDKAAWTNDQKKSIFGGSRGFGNGRWPYMICAIRKPDPVNSAAWGRAGQDVILNADLDIDNPEAFQTFFHEIGHVLTGTIIKRHKNWDGTPGTQSCSACPGDKEPVCSYCDNALQNIPKFTEAKMYNCHRYKYECNNEAPMEYLAGVFIGYFCENSPQKTADPYGWEWMNSMFHQKTFRGLVC